MTELLLRSRRGPSRREALIATGLFTLLAVAAYGPHVAHGGFYSDDWSHAANYRFAESPRYFNAVDQLQQFLGGRPLSALLMPVPQAIFGPHPSPQLALAAALGVATALCLFVLLRTLEMPSLHAGLIAALTLLIPWSDSSRLWPTAAVNSIAICLFLLGATVALRGFDHRGRRGSAMHAGAALLYLLSVLTYEVTAAAALLAGLLYFGRASRHRVLWSWAADVVAVGAGLLYSLLSTVSSRHVGTIGERIRDLPDFGRDSLLLLASAVEPFGSLGRPLQVLVLAAVAAVATVTLLRLRRGTADPALRDWARWAAIGAVVVAAAYFMFLGSNLHPRDPGIENRVNVLAGPAICLLVYAIVACACRLLSRSARTAALFTVAVAASIGVGYAVDLGGDRSDWRAAAERQRSILAQMDERLLPVPDGSTVVAFGYPAQTAPGVPVFDRPWDLSGALQLHSDAAVRAAFPVYEGIALRCSSQLLIDGGSGYGTFEIPYRRVYFFGPREGRRRIRSSRACRSALAEFRPGRLEA